MDYFLFNKSKDFTRGFLESAVYESGALCLLEPSSGKKGIFISRIMDSRQSRTVWNRIKTEVRLPGNTAVELRIYGAEAEELDLVKTVLKETGSSGQEKLNRMEHFLKCRFKNQGEGLLNQVTGQYIWIAVILWGNGIDSPRISDIQIFFPRTSFTFRLPEAYGEKNSFLERYLAIFQTLYEEAEQEIRSFPSKLDIGAADDETLMWLAKWLSMDNIHSWPPDRLRRYLAEGASVYAGRGTKRGICRMVQIYTGCQPYLIESEDRPGEFLLLISEKAVPDYPEYQALLRIIEEVKPAHIKADLVVLRPEFTLGRGTYLGINSVVQTHSQSILGQMSQIGYSILGGRI